MSNCNLGHINFEILNSLQVAMYISLKKKNLLLAWSINLRSASLRVDSTAFPVQSIEWNSSQSKSAHELLEGWKANQLSHIQN